MKTLAQLLHDARVTKGLSQKEIAEALGYSTAQVVSDWERGVRSPPGPVFRKLMKLYGIDTEIFYEAILAERTRVLESKIKKMLGMRRA